jgi:hypothetical protein
MVLNAFSPAAAIDPESPEPAPALRLEELSAGSLSAWPAPEPEPATKPASKLSYEDPLPPKRPLSGSLQELQVAAPDIQPIPKPFQEMLEKQARELEELKQTSRRQEILISNLLTGNMASDKANSGSGSGGIALDAHERTEVFKWKQALQCMWAEVASLRVSIQHIEIARHQEQPLPHTPIRMGGLNGSRKPPASHNAPGSHAHIEDGDDDGELNTSSEEGSRRLLDRVLKHSLSDMQTAVALSEMQGHIGDIAEIRASMEKVHEFKAELSAEIENMRETIVEFGAQQMEHTREMLEAVELMPGPPGEPGMAGPPGTQGPPGAQGVVPQSELNELRATVATAMSEVSEMRQMVRELNESMSHVKEEVKSVSKDNEKLQEEVIFMLAREEVSTEEKLKNTQSSYNKESASVASSSAELDQVRSELARLTNSHMDHASQVGAKLKDLTTSHTSNHGQLSSDVTEHVETLKVCYDLALFLPFMAQTSSSQFALYIY